MKTLRTTVAAAVILTAWVLATGLALAATPDEDMKPIKTGASITGVIEEDYSDGLLLTTDAGTTYLVLTPEEISLETEEAFHKRNKGKQVTLTGNVYRDEDGSLSLFVSTLPTQ